MWDLWIGSGFHESRLLLLGESAYSWFEDGNVRHPSATHAIELVEDVIRSFPANPFMNTLTRGLAGSEFPDEAQRAAGWDYVAFTNFVLETVGTGPRVRPTAEMWQRANAAFPQLLENTRARNVIVLGKTMWSMMPDADVWLTDDVQAYRLANGEFVVCWAVNHPSAGLSWRRLSDVIRFVQTRSFLREGP